MNIFTYIMLHMYTSANSTLNILVGNIAIVHTQIIPKLVQNTTIIILLQGSIITDKLEIS